MSVAVAIPEGKLEAALLRYPDGRTCTGPCGKTFPPEVFWIGGRWRGQCPTCYRSTNATRMLAVYNEDPDLWNRKQTMRRYDLTDADYDLLMSIKQCSICTDEFDSKNMHIDHDHSTGAVRGRLCGNCNRGLGLFRDNPELLRRAADYIEEHQNV